MGDCADLVVHHEPRVEYGGHGGGVAIETVVVIGRIDAVKIQQVFRNHLLHLPHAQFGPAQNSSRKNTVPADSPTLTTRTLSSVPPVRNQVDEGDQTCYTKY